MNFIFLLAFLLQVFPAKSARVVSETVWKMRLNGTDVQIVQPQIENAPNRIYNFAHSLENICTITRGNDGLFRVHLTNIFTLVQTAPVILDFGMDKRHFHFFEPQSCFMFNGFTFVISRHRLLNLTSIQRGNGVKLMREFPFDQLNFDHFAGRLIAKIGTDFFQISPSFVEGLWTRDFRLFPSQSTIPLGYLKLCSWNIKNPISWAMANNHLLYMLSEKSIYVTPICNQNESKFVKVLDAPSTHIPFYLFPLQREEKPNVLINYNDHYFPTSVILPILTLIFILLFVFKKKLTTFVNSNDENVEAPPQNPPPPPLYNFYENIPQEAPYDDRSIVIPKN